MKQSTHLLLKSIAAGTSCACAGIWAIAMLQDNSVFAIPLLILCLFLSLVFRVQLHDRRIARQREQWREDARDSSQWQYENITGPRL